ncbi:MAG TPA: nucleotidyltransferase family protein, partial [Pyrinomonadaceae bacterium]|nr:nucleotidyltransferase family protein [Pyrinomonadaceae bacterium]
MSTVAELSLAEFEAGTPLLYDSGAAGLGWWTIRDTPLADTPSGELLHQAFRLLTLQAAIHQTKIEKVFRYLRAAGVEPILIKGWSIARRYPEPALRPYGDIDLLVRHKDYSIANRVVAGAELRDCRVDIHPGIFELVDRPVDEVFVRSQLVPCGSGQARVLCDEDHLALLAVHFLKHGGWRPLWLCDIALMVESTAGDFDWDLCLGSDKRRVNWILSVIGLARELLGASINDERVAARAITPAWVSESVLGNWEQPFVDKHEPYNHRAPMRSYLTRPAGLIADLRRRWPNPILATITVNGTFGKRRRLRYQLRNCLQRA